MRFGRRRGGEEPPERPPDEEPAAKPPGGVGEPPETGPSEARDAAAGEEGEGLEPFVFGGSHQGPPPGVPERRRHPARRRLLSVVVFVLVAAGAFFVGLLLFNNLVMPRLIHGRAQVSVPDLTTLTFEQAEQVVRSIGLTVSRAGERFDPEMPRGLVLSQDPGAGTPVRTGRRVMVVVSLGEEFSSVPALFGESQRGARLLLQRAGLDVGGVTRAPSDEVGDGLVVASDPPAESVLPRDTPVNLLISTGTGPENFVMPDLVGREIGGVRRQLESLGFRVFTPPAAPTVGPIVTQEPPAGSRITRDVTIVLGATGRIIR